MGNRQRCWKTAEDSVLVAQDQRETSSFCLLSIRQDLCRQSFLPWRRCCRFSFHRTVTSPSRYNCSRAPQTTVTQWHHPNL